MADSLVALVTAESEAQARAIATHLLENKLAACVNLVPVRSLYLWDGALQDDAEVLMIIKTTAPVFREKLIAAVQAQHSYEVPEIIGLPIVFGAADYLRWIEDAVADDQDAG